jgi:hypothetical protein
MHYLTFCAGYMTASRTKEKALQGVRMLPLTALSKLRMSSHIVMQQIYCLSVYTFTLQ